MGGIVRQRRPLNEIIPPDAAAEARLFSQTLTRGGTMTDPRSAGRLPWRRGRALLAVPGRRTQTRRPAVRTKPCSGRDCESWKWAVASQVSHVVWLVATFYGLIGNRFFDAVAGYWFLSVFMPQKGAAVFPWRTTVQEEVEVPSVRASPPGLNCHRRRWRQGRRDDGGYLWTAVPPGRDCRFVRRELSLPHSTSSRLASWRLCASASSRFPVCSLWGAHPKARHYEKGANPSLHRSTGTIPDDEPKRHSPNRASRTPII